MNAIKSTFKSVVRNPIAAALKAPIVAPLSQSIDKNLHAVLTNREVLRTASVLINLNSYRRKWTRAAVRHALTSLELPVRTDQERMLALLEQLNIRLEDLERREMH